MTFSHFLSFASLTVLISLILMSGAIQPAHASFWVECNVTVILDEPGQDGLYPAKIIKAKVTDGHMPAGEPCLTNYIDKVRNLDLEGEVAPKQNQEILLKYNYYNGMGPEGVVESESWQYLP